MTTIYEDIAAHLKELPWFQDQIIYHDGLPEEPDDAACVAVFGGDPERHHGSKHPAWTMFGVEVRIRSNTPSLALQRCSLAMEKMDGWTNAAINGTMYRSIFLTTPPTLIDREPGGQVTYSIAFTVTRRGM